MSFLFFLSLQALLFPITTSACSKAFQEITPEQLKARLSLIAENKTEDIQNMNIDPSIPYVLTFNSKTGIKFQITTDSSLTEPAIVFSSSDNLIKSWLIGHEIHPYTSPSKNIQHTEKPSFEQLIELLISKNIFTLGTAKGK